jgi:cell fate regulator YaaT (PSP1 superfamily)
MSNQEFAYALAVRFIGKRKVYTFGTNDPLLQMNDYVVVESSWGTELAQAALDVVPVSQVKLVSELKPVIRKATNEDIKRNDDNREQAKSARKICDELIKKLKLEMNLISADYTLDRNKIMFVYVADDRVDFRDLLKELSASLRCRIELRQIGPRDKAKMIGGLGTCGLETCCSRFMTDFEVISINMAKNQLLALNIQKLSGQCGKLMCCLRHEDDLYKKMRVGLPKMNAQVKVNEKMYRMTNLNLIANQVKLENREEALVMTVDEFKKLLGVKPDEVVELEIGEEVSDEKATELSE